MRVYVIAASDLGPSKIGISESPEKRRRELQVGHPRCLTVRYSVRVGDVAHARVVERAAHRSLATVQADAGNEWFKVPPAEAAIVTRAAASSVAALGDHVTAFAELERREGLSWLKSVEGRRAALDSSDEDSPTLDQLRLPNMLEVVADLRRSPTSSFTFNDYLNTCLEGAWHRAIRQSHNLRRPSGTSCQSYIETDDILAELGIDDASEIARRWIEWSLARDLTTTEVADLAAVWKTFAEHYTKIEHDNPYVPEHGCDDQVDDVAIFAQTNDPSRPDQQCVIFQHEHFRAVLFPQRAEELCSLDGLGRSMLKPLSSRVSGFVGPVMRSSLENEPLALWLRDTPKRRDAVLARFLDNPAKRYPQLAPRPPAAYGKALAVVHYAMPSMQI